MKKYILLAFLFMSALIIFPGCSEEEEPARFVEYMNSMNNNPVTAENWLSEQRAGIIKQMDMQEDYYKKQGKMFSFPIKGSIEWYELDGEDYYLVEYCRLPMSDVDYIFLYDAEGNEVLKLGGYVPADSREQEFEKFYKDAVSKGILWEYMFTDRD